MKNSSPYPGLRPFEMDENDIFFGRDEHIEQLIDKLDTTHFIAVLGPSGCGKSSLVRAGLVPNLRKGYLTKAGVHWQVAVCRPGNHPFYNLAEALLKDEILGEKYKRYYSDHITAVNFLKIGLNQEGPISLHKILQETPLPDKTNLLLVVDQFEEIFRYYKPDDKETSDTEEAKREEAKREAKQDEAAVFVALLLASSKSFPFLPFSPLSEGNKEPHRVYVLLTMRSAYLGDCALFDGLAEAINAGLFLTPNLNRDQLREAIVEPARMFDGEMDSKLINNLLNETSDYYDRLPVLQHALRQMWFSAKKEKEERKVERIVLTSTHYDKIGGLKNALSNHADKVYYKKLTVEQQPIAEMLFRCLTEREHDTKDRYRRHPVKLEVVAKVAKVSTDKVSDVVEVFREEGRSFLTPTLGVKLVADSVLDISHESLIRQWERLRNWSNDEANMADTYHRLEDHAHHWEEKPAYLLSGIELELALQWRKHEPLPTKEWARRYGKDFDLVMRLLEESEKQKLAEDKKANTARRRKLLAMLGGIVFFAGLATYLYWAKQQVEQAKQLAEIAKEKRTKTLFESQLADAALLAQSENYADAKTLLKQSHELDTDPSLDKKRFPARTLLEWFTNLMGTSSQRSYPVGVPLLSVAVSPDGQRLVATGEKSTLAAFDVVSGKFLYLLPGHHDKVMAVVFHPQGKWLASAGDDKKIILWSPPTSDKEPPTKLNEWSVSSSVWALAVNPEGTLLASGGTDNNVTLWEVETGRSLRTFPGHQNNIYGLAFSPDGKQLATASYDKTARLWDVESGEMLQILEGHSDNVEKVAFSPDGKTLATSSKDKSVRLWEVSTGKPVGLLLGHTKAVYGLGFVENGLYLISASEDFTLRVWDVENGITRRVLQGHFNGVNDLVVHPGQIFSASNDGQVRRWDEDKVLPEPKQEVLLPSPPASTAIAPDGSKVAVGFKDGSLQLYSLANSDDHRLLWEQRDAHKKRIQDLEFNSKGTLLASASFDNTVKLWQVEDNKLVLRKPFPHQKQVNAVAFSPKNDILATAGDDGQVNWFSVNDEPANFPPLSPQEGEAIYSISYNTKGTQLLTASDYDVRLWDVNDLSKPKLIEEYPKAQDLSMWAAFNPDDNQQQIASVGRDQVVNIYSPKNKLNQYRLTGHESTIYRVIYSPDGHQIATASGDATVRFWDLDKESKLPTRQLFALRLPAQRSNNPAPLYDFDFRCSNKDHNCWIAVPLTNNKLMLYQLDNIYQEKAPETKLVVEAGNEQFIPLPIYRTGFYPDEGIALLNGFIDYMQLLNATEGGINGVKLNWEECDTAYQADRAVMCYDKLKDKGSIFNFVITPAVIKLMERAKNDQKPLVTIGYGPSEATDGSVYPYIFPLVPTYWEQTTAKIKFIGEKEGGMDKLKGKTIAIVYHHSDYGKESFQVLEDEAKKYGFTVKYFPIEHPGLDPRLQAPTWDQIQRLKPDWIILRGLGRMNAITLEQAKRIGFSADHLIGVWWSGSEEEVQAAGEAAKGFIAAGFHLGDKSAKVLQEIRQQVYAKGNGMVDKKGGIFGSMNYIRGVIYGILNTEAIRTAQGKYGKKPLTGEEIQWGLEHLNINEKRLAELGAKELLPPIQTSCAYHAGRGKVIFQQWDGQKWNRVSDWIAPDYEVTDKLVKEKAEKYMEEKGMEPRWCSPME